MSRALWLSLAAAAIWLWASLVPQVTYATASSGEPAGDVLVVWPGWAVQQDLGPLSGTIGRFQIWVSSAPDAGEITLQASLVDASTNEILRQATINATPSYVPVARSLAFPTYDVDDGQLVVRARSHDSQTPAFPTYDLHEGQRLLLQLQVADFERRQVVFGLAPAQSDYANLALNGVPDAASGPLAFSNALTGSGLRAALDGKPDARSRLILALALTGLLAIGHPLVAGWDRLRRAAARINRASRQATTLVRRRARPKRQRNASGAAKVLSRALAVPWYPWPAALIPILHFLAINPLHFGLAEALVPAAGVLLLVTASMASLGLLVRRWHGAATAVAGVTAVVFGYGHVEQALDGRLDDQTLFPVAAVLAAALFAITLRSHRSLARWTPFLNLTAGVLLLIQIVSLAAAAPGPTARAPQPLTRTLQVASDNHPDIYHIILDAYARDDALSEYDNSSFLNALEERGFYVAKEATSNYETTRASLPSSLNLAYLHDIKPQPPQNSSDSRALVQSNALAATLKNLGYTYVHLESGNVITDRAPQADISVTFTPAGTMVSDVQAETSYASTAHRSPAAWIRENGFLRALLATTALRQLTGHRFHPADDSPYDWWSPERALRMFEFISEPIQTPGPKYTFVHILKPHEPMTFDRHGNMLISDRSEDEFSDSHDLTVPNAYVGQLIYINSLVLKTVDRILDHSAEKPIIVIAADHGRRPYKNHVLAAFHLPHGGNAVLYPSISSVNHFRAILDYYFGMNLGLLRDITLDSHL
ncbi:MAG: hypothetical protein OXG17_08395 [Chloroflexi bacterium]|nr:hypothetical protein [Chloroflexota bacterium]